MGLFGGGYSDFFDSFDQAAAAQQQAAAIQSAGAKKAGDIGAEAGVEIARLHANAQIKSAQLASNTAAANRKFLKEQADIARADLAPFREAGVTGIDMLQQVLLSRTDPNIAYPGRTEEEILSGAEAQAELQHGVAAIEASTAAKGGLRNGRTLAALFDFGQTQAAQNISEERNRDLQVASNLSSIGANAAAGQASVSTTLGQNVAQSNLATAQLQQQGLQFGTTGQAYGTEFGATAQANAAIASANAQAQGLIASSQLQLQKAGYEAQLGQQNSFGSILSTVAGSLFGGGSGLGIAGGGAGGLGSILGGLF